MSKGITKSPPLEDIPLAVEQQRNAVVEDKTVPKTNSLRRLFKKSVKQKDENESTSSIPEKDSEEPRRFHLRLGSRTKHLETGDLEDMPSSSSSSSKLTLKRSIYKYWQTLFKNPKSASADDLAETPSGGPSLKTKDSLENKGDISSDEESEDEMDKLADSVHALKVAVETDEIEPKEEETKIATDERVDNTVEAVKEDTTDEDNETF